jgi:hypothetical protein
MSRRLSIIAALTVGVSSMALAQRALRGKDAPAPVPAEAVDDAGSAAPQGQGAGQNSGQSAGKKHKKDEKAAVVDAGPPVPPKFKDDLTPAEIARASASSAALDCSNGRCEGLYRKQLARHEWVVHVRPSQPQPGQVAEVVVDFAELLEVADPELGDKKPLDNLMPIATLETYGKFLMHPIDGSAGSYGFHFTPQAVGLLDLRVESGEQGASAPTVEFGVPVGQTPPKSAHYEVKPYEPRYVDPVAWSMADLGSAWGALWGVALGTGHGDVAVLEATVQRLAKTGVDEWPLKAQNDSKYVALARSFADASGKLSGAKPSGLRDALTSMEKQQCERCHAAYAWGLTSDVSSWPQVKIGPQKEEE